MYQFANITPNELAIVSTAVAIAISEGMDADDLNVIGNFLETVATNILTIAAQKEYIQKSQEDQNQNIDIK